MSELKARHVADVYDDYAENPCGDYSQVYLKSEADAVIAELKARNHDLEEERRWRKFPDEKPEEDTWCIVFHDGEIDSDHYTRFAYNNKCDFALYGNEVTHWMPLPSAPKEDK